MLTYLNDKEREIYRKASEILAKKEYRERCIKAEICPVCGEALHYEFYDDGCPGIDSEGLEITKPEQSNY